MNRFLPAAAVAATVVLPPLAGQNDPTADATALQALTQRFAVEAGRERAAALAWAARAGQPPRVVTVDHRVVELIGLREGRPVYLATTNHAAADTTSTDELWVGGRSGLNLTGNNTTLHEWDAGGVRLTHQEFAGRVVQVDAPAAVDDHATHVAGTMVADGGATLGASQGMANQASLRAYDWNNDAAEMAAAAAAGARVSNHSYGVAAGWDSHPITLNGVDFSPWYGDVRVSAIDDAAFGLYDATARAFDQIAFNAPSYLPCVAASNDRGNGDPTPGVAHVHWDSVVGNWVIAMDAHPIDGGATGYDTIPTMACAKNVLTIGAADDIPGGWANAAQVAQNNTSFSSWGPTDDGRIKPDLVGNGDQLFSPVAFVPGTLPPMASNADYDVYSGTSMATPNVSGSLGLLLQHHRALHRNLDLRAATLKALVIHTADEAGANPGPDYSFGWGLLNAWRAAQLLSAEAARAATIVESALDEGQSIESCVQFPGGGALRVTLCWTDPPGAAEPLNALNPRAKKLVNDLDLRVVDPNGVAHLPWALDPTNPGNAAVRADNDRDNVEQVVVDNAPAGRYRVVISHKGVLANAPQRYSWVSDAPFGAVQPIGDPCATSLGLPHLNGNGCPSPCNAAFAVNATDLVPLSPVLWVAGQTQLSPAFALAPLGAPPGCELHVLPSVSFTTLASPRGGAQVALPIPCAAPLGARVYVQAFDLDPALPQQLKVASTEALEITIVN